MNKERLKKLRSLIKEAEHLEIEIEDVRFQPSEKLADTAKDYRTGYPHTIMIEGYGDNRYAELKRKLYEKLGKVQAERWGLENWLDSVQDPELRTILRMQYVDGLTIEAVAEELEYSVATINRRLQKFWQSDME